MMQKNDRSVYKSFAVWALILFTLCIVSTIMFVYSGKKEFTSETFSTHKRQALATLPHLAQSSLETNQSKRDQQALVRPGLAKLNSIGKLDQDGSSHGEAAFHLAQGQVAEATEAARNNLEQHGDTTQNLDELATSLQAAGNEDEAIQIYEKMVAEGSDTEKDQGRVISAYLRLISLLIKHNDKSKAQETLDDFDRKSVAPEYATYRSTIAGFRSQLSRG